MIEQGFDPDKGGRLILPMTLKLRHTPSFVIYHRFVTEPFLVMCDNFNKVL